MKQEKAPGAITKLVLGALSIVFCCTGIVGLVLGLIARGGPSTAKLEEQNPGKYTAGSLKLRKIGRILGVVGWPLSLIWIIFYIVFLLGTSFAYFSGDTMRMYQDAMDEYEEAIDGYATPDEATYEDVMHDYEDAYEDIMHEYEDAYEDVMHEYEDAYEDAMDEYEDAYEDAMDEYEDAYEDAMDEYYY